MLTSMYSYRGDAGSRVLREWGPNDGCNKDRAITTGFTTRMDGGACKGYSTDQGVVLLRVCWGMRLRVRWYWRGNPVGVYVVWRRDIFARICIALSLVVGWSDWGH